MLFLKIYRFLVGYVRFVAKGEFPERLLNLLAGQYVSVWNVQHKQGRLYANMTVRDYKRIRRLRGKTGITTRIQGRYGLPFVLKKYKKRAGFGVGLILFLALLKVGSMFVWNVQVSGTAQLDPSQILAVCRELGVREGVLRTAIDTEQVRTRLALQVPGVAWAAVNIEGVRATIEVTEVQNADLQQRPPCNLRAAVDGTILAIEVTEGQILVQRGDAVAKGQLLVSGVVEYADQTTAFKHASGKIIAQTARQARVFIPFAQTYTRPTGKVTRRQVLSFFGLKIPLYLGSVKGEYQKQTDTHYFTHKGMYLPIYLHSATFVGQESHPCTVDAATAEQMARDRLAAEEKQLLAEAEVLEFTDEVKPQPDGILLRRQYVCKENIAIQENLSINTTNS